MSIKNKKSSIKPLDINKNFHVFVFVVILNLTLTIIPPLIGLIWLHNLKKNKCKCADIKWYNKYISFYFIFIITYALLSLLFLIIFRKTMRLSYISLLLFIYNMISYFIIIYYISLLNKNKCECSNSVKKDFLFVWYIIKLGLPLLLIFSLAITLLLGKNKNI